nr:erythrocyte membrane protein 1, PfEMP1, putative [Plasmodium sp. DRC-Itaito]
MAPAGDGGGGDGGGEEKWKSKLKNLLRNCMEIWQEPNIRTMKQPEGSTPKDPCRLQFDYNTNNTSGFGREYPCEGRPEVRFSDEYGGQCTNSKIHGNDDKTGGACAPLRRLFLCDQHLSHMKTENINTKDNLLLEVCLAALHEGKLLEGYHNLYRGKYGDTGSTICTVLARSFADIGDIEEKNEKAKEVEERYGGDENFFKLREDWWAHNRKTVWKAITCEAGNSTYFRPTCNSNDIRGPSVAQNKCTCINGDPPTYFDYVPQYLRWFEEWAEDFCTKRKHKLQNAIKQCRGEGENGKKRYCDLNGYDCEKTASGKHVYIRGDGCTKCSVACDPFVKWIRKQEEEFIKQKKKYNEEIKKAEGTNGTSGSRRKKRGAINEVYDGYDKEFYEKLEEHYGTIDEFLGKLSKEGLCKSQPQVGKEKRTSINFKNHESEEIFSRTEICKPCPWCGVEPGGPPWEHIDNEKCANINNIKNYKEEDTTKIPKLIHDSKKRNIVQKYRKFCDNSENNDQIEKWECHYEEKDKRDGNDETEESDNCILGEWKDMKNQKNPISYYVFFYRSVTEMLKESIEWREELKNCLENTGQTCGNKQCERNCKCYKKWVEGKKNEWKQIKEHFKKQKGFGEQIEGAELSHYMILETFLEYEFFKKVKDEKTSETETLIDKLLQHELDDAEKCLQTHQQDPCPIPDTAGARSGEETVVDNGDEEDEDEEETEEEAPPPQKEEDTKEAPCKIVQALFGGNTFNEACTLKYVKNKGRAGWDCRGGTTIAKGGEGERGGTTTEGGICIPPRRKNMYVKRIENVDENMSEVKLRDAFIESAAVETFFLWDRYKKLNTKSKGDKGGEATLPGLMGEEDGDEEEGEKEDPQSKLESEGTIPDEFKKQMFYTLGDYRDILYIGSKDNGSGIDELFKNDEKMDKIKSNIDKVFQNGDEKKYEEKRKSWWKQYGSDIWEGMLCALTYKDNGDQNTKESGNAQKIIKIEDGAKGEKLFNKLKENNNEYETVSYGANETGPMAPGDGQHDHEGTKLKDFVLRPTYFRWLQEWGEEFCKKRTRMLRKVKKDCKVDEGDEKCSGDGEDCTQTVTNENGTVPDLECPSCANSCRKYKKWIKKKRTQYEEQEKIYTKQKADAKSNKGNIYDNEFVKKLNDGYDTIESFLDSLKVGPNTDNNNGCSHINFKEQEKTFGHESYCDPCSKFTVKCMGNVKCTGTGENGCTKKTIDAGNFKEKGEHVKEVVMHVSDNGGKTFESDLGVCENKGIFEGIREDKWECGNKCGLHVCGLKNGNRSIDGKNQIILFRALFKQWVENFLDDYNKIKQKIPQCIETNKTESTCIRGCSDKCNCLDKWLKKKKDEWKEIREYFYNEYNVNSEKYFYVKSFINSNVYPGDINNALNKDETLDKLQESARCSNSENTIKEECEKQDVIEILIDRLQNKIDTCKENHTPNDKECTETLHPHNSDILDVDDVQEVEEENDLVDMPKICDGVVPRPPRPPPEPPMSCVEKAAQQLRKEAQRKVNSIDDKLKGTGKDFSKECKGVKKENGNIQEDTCKYEKTYENSVKSLNGQCNNIGKERFEIGKTWQCINVRDIGKDICIPPRRKEMCLQGLGYIGRSTVSDSSSLLKRVQQVAQNEGDDIIRKLLQQNSCDESAICDAMKYSFADLGDIIRGRDLWNKNSRQRGLEDAFMNIYNKLDENTRKKYKDPFPKYLELRSDWWDANRKDIWKAMTCNAPDGAKFLRKDPNGSSRRTSSSTNGIFSSDPKCGYDKEPPDYDYIPQPFRWMQEWSESFCKLLNKELDNFKEECEKCKSGSCGDDTNGVKCKKCKTQCEKYRHLVKEWRNQMEKQKETYIYLYNNNNMNKKDKMSSEKYFQNFLDKLRAECNGKDNVNKYLDEASHCTDYKFTHGNNRNNKKYAFKEPPKGFEAACRCNAPDPLDNCPYDEKKATYCKKFKKIIACAKTYTNNLNDWNDMNVINKDKENKGVLVPPRRRQLCIRNINIKLDSITNKDDFKRELMRSAYTEAYLLCKKHDKDKEKALEEIYCSFADYGDIVKGTDMMDNHFLKRLKDKLDILLKEDGGNGIDKDRGKWWTNIRDHVWHAMLCGYKKAGGKIEEKDCSLPKDDETHQFLRWLVEWGKVVCEEKQKRKEILERECECFALTGKSGYEIINTHNCKYQLQQYIRWNTFIKKSLDLFNIKYENVKKNNEPSLSHSELTMEEYIEAGIKIGECNLFEVHEIIDIFRNTGTHPHKEVLKRLCPELDFTYNITENIEDVADIHTDKEEGKTEHITPAIEPPPKSEEPETASPKVPEEKVKPPPPSQRDEPVDDEPVADPTILQTTIPLGVAVALTSIAFLFLKRKPKPPVKLFSVLDIPKGEFDIPTNLSPNRYVPYGTSKHRGKRYIYIEGDSDSGHYYDDTTDITSSSESEYEEIDTHISHMPKYKTLIEVVLEPSKRDTQNDIPRDDIPRNESITDEEWNKLKENFISQYLQNEQKDVPQSDISKELPLNTQPNTLYFDKPEEKPFIMSIHDRNLLSGEEYNYDMTTNNDDIPISGNLGSYSGNNDPISDNPRSYSDNPHPYSGIDLINDALSRQPIDIYDEILKRKENELFGTENPKRTTSNNVAKHTNTDPILNQIDLFHKWLDRHRDMCEKFSNNKEEMLNKLKDEWDKDNNQHSNIPYVLNTDVSIQIDMDKPKPSNMEDTNMDNSVMDTILDDLDQKFKEPYFYDIYDDDMFSDVNDEHNTSIVNPNDMEKPSKVQIEMNVKNSTMEKEKFPISDIWST